MADNTIKVKGDMRHEEGIAAATILPGHLIEQNTDGHYIKHATAGGICERLVAKENYLAGKAIPTTSYADDDRLLFWVVEPGSVVQVLLKGGVGNNYIVGMQVGSAGDGTLTDIADLATGSHPIAEVVEALDLSDSALGNQLGKVRFL